MSSNNKTMDMHQFIKSVELMRQHKNKLEIENKKLKKSLLRFGEMNICDIDKILTVDPYVILALVLNKLKKDYINGDNKLNKNKIYNLIMEYISRITSEIIFDKNDYFDRGKNQ